MLVTQEKNISLKLKVLDINKFIDLLGILTMEVPYLNSLEHIYTGTLTALGKMD
jgi:hypothetical protein